MSDPSAYFKNKLIAECSQMSVSQTKAMIECAKQVLKMPLKSFDGEFEIEILVTDSEEEE